MSAITDIFGSSSDSSAPTPVQYNTWQPSNTTGQDTNFNNAIQQNLQLGNSAVPGWTAYLGALEDNPYQAGAQTAGNAAGTAYTNTGNQAVGNSNALSGASNTVLNTAFDPQSQLYNTMNQNNTDATNASLAARGLNTSGVGADLANQSNINFNEQWLNNLLGQQTTGLAAASSGFTNAGQLGTGGAQSIGLGGSAPLSVYNAGVNQLGSGLSNYNAGTNSTNQQALSDIMAYLSLGAGQSNQQGNFNQQYFEDQSQSNAYDNSLNNQLWSSIGNLGNSLGLGSNLTSGISSLFGGGGGGVDWANAASLNATDPSSLLAALPDVAAF